MSGAAMLHFLEQVTLKEGPLGKRNAMKSLQAHIRYYERGGKKTHMMRSVLAEFESRPPPADAVDGVVESAASEINDAVSVRRHKLMGQGNGLSPVERRAVELAAMKVAESELQKLGFTDIQDVAQSESFDFLAVLDGEEWFIEVKGTTNSRADQILLTANEVILHQRHALRSCLIVVSQVRLNRATGAATGGVPVTFKPWGTQGWNLVPIAYRAVQL